jgi:hypothetical protein
MPKLQRFIGKQIHSTDSKATLDRFIHKGDAIAPEKALYVNANTNFGAWYRPHCREV